MTEKYYFRMDDQEKPFCGDPTRAKLQMMRRSQPWKDLKEEHFNDLISMIYSVDCVPPSSSYVPWVLLSVSEKANLQMQLVFKYLYSCLHFILFTRKD